MLRFFASIRGIFDLNMEERYLRPTAELLPQSDPVLLADQLILSPKLQIVHQIHLVPTVEQIAPSGGIRTAQCLSKL